MIDGADNCVYDIFAAPEQVFDLVFAPGTDVAFAEELENRPDAEHVFKALATILANRVPKSQVQGIHGTLFYGLIEKRMYYPTLRDEEAMNPDGSRLRADGLRLCREGRLRRAVPELCSRRSKSRQSQPTRHTIDAHRRIDS